MKNHFRTREISDAASEKRFPVIGLPLVVAMLLAESGDCQAIIETNILVDIT